MILINAPVKLHIDGSTLQRTQKFIRILGGQFRYLLCRHFFIVLVPVLESFAILTLNGNIFGSSNDSIFHCRILANFVKLFYNSFAHGLKVSM